MNPDISTTGNATSLDRATSLGGATLPGDSASPAKRPRLYEHRPDNESGKQPTLLAIRRAIAKNFFTRRGNQSQPAQPVNLPPDHIEDFLGSSKDYGLTELKWILLIKDLGYWAKQGGFTDRSGALAEVTGPAFRKNFDTAVG